ncbi:5'-methylthioadenosine/S-adenosylhomocysteine nucleosidase [Aquibacillus koreensis]|uniref:5'-methylthioadenosine/S-adenosylhomocysteine nucleosidase n=1 Tax=Aquibacillus koreensis TaxID=279446 RepID=A0A9X3WL40_9BACI|nr:5'-methylthioadenosine/S-adenosylhomocysteine nucleosidase [Aquibacillus koreensis]MCT2537640.1 5'-methylthioadenosine/S-adenosylhomocysteine nucleosidase [Aquibacillus koreensis]MDC3419086.1 5'-methylthioadenosine/S-adenosylhomocysteine nucleosidase [Aquibacillus koreensis]
MPIGIIGAMDEEIKLLQNKMVNKNQEDIAGCQFTTGTLHGKEVVLLKSGIGKVNAAIATTILHEKYNPNLVINTGSAGGFAEDLQIGDLVISTEVTHHDVDVTAFDYEYGQVPGLPPTYKADEKLINLTMRAIDQLNNVKGLKGLIATGDSFMQDEERVRFVRGKFPSMIAAEMEAAAIAQTCYQYKTPFVVIRALSDIAGKESSISFDAFLETAATNAANLIIELVDNI